MYKFFVAPENVGDGEARIEGQDAHHIKNVLRMKPGEEILVCTGDEWEYTCKVTALENDLVTAEILDANKPGKELPSKIILFQCMPKKDKFEMVIQKAVELGAVKIVPVMSKRCITVIDDKKAASRCERWNAIAGAAAKQAGRMIEPEVGMPIKFKDALKEAAELDIKLIPYEKAEGMDTTRSILGSIEPGQSIGILIGPEGGFEEKEVEQAQEAGFSSITLGRRILRTETAPLAILSMLVYLLDK